MVKRECYLPIVERRADWHCSDRHYVAGPQLDTPGRPVRSSTITTVDHRDVQ